MTYLMIESSIRTHRKFLAAGPEASWLWVCGLGYCQDGLTDGYIPETAVDYLGVKNVRALVTVLEHVRLWEPVQGGWRMHDYLEHNKSADEVREIMRKRAEGGKLGGRPKKNLQGFGDDATEQNLIRNPVLPVLPVLPEHPDKSVSSAPPLATHEPTAVLTFPTVGKDGTSWPLTQAQIDEWTDLFPNLDVLAECRKALAWIRAMPGRRKTGRGMERFLVGWFTRSVDRGGAVSAAATPRRAEVVTTREWHCSHADPKCHSRYFCEKVRDERDRLRRQAAAS